ncbi:hypothetical protein [Amycolatopsis sp. WAC 04169]|uniref:hypothetical protein n=1 Tax=Amycolatopsis sp. WAC 04169 TaxID=2203197 RepID=UPI000F766C5D|nr:hypothetical protein [Amycolatopsis sp. WAC 04169]
MELTEADAGTLAADETSTAVRRELTVALTVADAGEDGELVAATLKVLELTDHDEAHASKYRVPLHGDKGMQVDDHDFQTNTCH